MSAAGFQKFVELFAFPFQRRDQRIEYGIELFQFEQRGEAHASGKNIIRRLAVVNVIIGVDDGIVAQGTAQNFDGPICYDLVAVHVEANAGACLEDVHHKFLVPLALLDFFSGLDDRIGALVV